MHFRAGCGGNNDFAATVKAKNDEHWTWQQARRIRPQPYFGLLLQPRKSRTIVNVAQFKFFEFDGADDIKP